MDDANAITPRKGNWKMGGQAQQPPVEELPSNRVTWSGLWTVFDALGLMVVLLIQGSILNYFLILYNEGNAGWYFWFLVDFVILITFMFSITFAWRHYQRQRRERTALRSPYAETEVQRTQRLGKGLFKFTFPKQLGMLPLIYFCWILYSLALVIKIYLVFAIDVPEKMVLDKTAKGADVLALTLASAAIVFLLWVEAHRNLEDETQRQLSKPCLDDLISHTLFEIFDSVIFLDMIIPEDEKEMAYDKANISQALRAVILILASVNFMMPGLGLYRLSRTHFGERSGRLKVVNETTGLPSTRGLGISIIYHLLRLFAVNTPFLVIRVHLSQSFGKDLSIFAVKNVLGIWVALRSLIPEIKEFFHISNLKKQALIDRKNGNPHPAIKVDGYDKARGWEMSALFDNNTKAYDASTTAVVTNATSSVAEEVNLREDSDVDHEALEEQLQNGLLQRY